MCLYFKTKRYWFARQRKQESIGYKIFIPMDDANKVASFVRDNIYSTNKWLWALNLYPIMFGGNNYSCFMYRKGFHIFKNKQSALEYLGSKFGFIYAVKYTHVVAEGIDWDLSVVVAKRMKILERVS